MLTATGGTALWVRLRSALRCERAGGGRRMLPLARDAVRELVAIVAAELMIADATAAVAVL